MRLYRLAAVVPLVLTLSPRGAGADRAVGPIDRLSAWTLELGSALSYLDRATSPAVPASDDAGDGSELALTPWLRVWPTDWLDVELRQPVALERGTVSGAAGGEVSRSALHDVELRSSLLVERGGLAGGTSLAFVLPTGGWSVSSQRIALTAAAIGGWRALPGGHLYARPTYTARAGEFELEAARAVGLELGLAQRLGAVSLVPRASVERTLSLLDRGQVVAGAFTTWRAGIEAAVELAPDFTAALRLDWAGSGAHRLAGGGYGGARELAIGLDLGYAWDLGAGETGGLRVPDPAAIRLADARIGARPATAARLRELRHLVPRLRLATLDAERAAGGARGEMVVHSSGDIVEVDDRVGAPALARAVADFYRRTLPGWARTTDRVEITLCFERCADTHL